MSSGECLLYCYIDDFSNVSGEADHYLRADLYKVPQSSNGKLLFDKQVIKYADDDGYISLSVKYNTHVLIEVPTTGLKVGFIVPEDAYLNLADFATGEVVEGEIVIVPTEHHLLTGLDNDDHPQYLNEARFITSGDARYALILTANENYVTDAEKIILSNTSGVNTGDQNDHGLLNGLTDDDHLQYLNQSRFETSGDNRYVKKQNISVSVFPEYPSAILYADGTSNNGSFVSGYEVSGGIHYTYYNWTADYTDQHGEIIFRYKVPSEFISWQANAITFKYRTGVENTDKIDVTVYKNGVVSPISTSTGLTNNNVWTTLTISSGSLNSVGADDELVFRINCVASNGVYNFVHTGDFTFNYIT